MKILGIQKHHLSSVCLFEDDNLIYFNQEERLSRTKKDVEDKAKIDKAKADAAAKKSGVSDDDTGTPTVINPLNTDGPIQGPGIGVRDALAIPGRAEPAFQELLDKAEFNFGLPDYIFTVDRDKKTGELGQLGKLLLEAVEKGLTEKQFLDRAMLTDWWQSNAGSVRERIIDLNKYKELQKKGLDVSKSDFGMYQTSKMRQVKDRAKTLAGVTLDDASAQKIVEDIYNGFLDNDPLAIDRLIIPYVSKSTNLYGKGAVTGFGGEALQIQQSLASIAKANGLSIADVLPKLGAGIAGRDAEQTTIQEILSGNIDLNTILSNARQIAAQGQPEYVRKLLGSGYNLEDIYAPYKQTMASVLEISPDQIDLNDNSLRMAINDKGDMVFSPDRISRAKKEFGSDLINVAMKVAGGTPLDRSIAEGTEIEKQIAKRVDLRYSTVQDVSDFQNALDKVNAAKYSPGRAVANLLLPGSQEGSGFLYKGISGFFGASYRIFADLLLVLGKAKKAYDA